MYIYMYIFVCVTCISTYIHTHKSVFIHVCVCVKYNMPADSRRGLEHHGCEQHQVPSAETPDHTGSSNLHSRDQLDCREGTLEGAAIPGHKDHIEYIKEQQNLFFAHYVATKNKIYLEYMTGVQLGETVLIQ